MKTTIILILISLFFAGCHSNSKLETIPVIDVGNVVGTGNILNLSDFADSIHYVKLNTTENNLITYASQFSYEDELFFFLDTESVVKLYNKDGTFKQNIGKLGQGPEEYPFCTGFDYFPGLNEILLHGSQSFLFYDLEGNFKRRIKLYENNTNRRSISLYQKVLYFNPTTFVSDITSWDNASYKFLVFEDSLQIIKGLPNNKPFDKGGKNTRMPNIEDGVMYYYANSIVHYKPYEDTIFTIDKDLNIKEYMIFDYGKYKYSSMDLSKSIIVSKIQESSGYLFLKFAFGNLAPEPFEDYNDWGRKTINHFVCGIFDKKTRKLTLLNQARKGELGFKNDIDGGPSFWPKYVNRNGEMVSYCQADEFIEAFEGKENIPDNVKEILKNLKDDDNPIIVIAKLKE